MSFNKQNNDKKKIILHILKTYSLSELNDSYSSSELNDMSKT